MADTINLLKECDAGIKMGIDAIDEVLSHVKDENLKDLLSGYKQDYNSIQDEIDDMLGEYNESASDPDPLAKGFATLKTGFKLAFDESDSTIANLITDGCNTGIKSLNEYLNEYDSATDKSKATTKKLIRLMDKQAHEMRVYL